MDRGQRPFLNWRRGLPVGAAVAVGLLLLCAGPLRAQTPPPPGASPLPSATPWVQASPPPGLATATPELTPTPHPPKPPKLPRPPHPSLSPSFSPAITPEADDVKQEMMRRRTEEKRDTGEADKASPPASATPPLDRREEKRDAKQNARSAMRLDQLPPDERAAYQRNLPVWSQLPPEEREGLRREFAERTRQEAEKAYQESGLRLDPDQREVFDLRYRQERRKLERELQAKINAERQRRLAEITEGLKAEFAGRTTPGTPGPTPSATVKPTSTP